MVSFNSDRVESRSIGERTRIWGVTHVLPGAVIGSDCNIADFVLIENDVVIGDNVTVKSGVQLWDGTRLEDGAFIGPNVTFTNDKFPVSGNRNYLMQGVTVKRNASVGGGAVVTKNVLPGKLVVGNPARVVGDAPHRRSV